MLGIIVAPFLVYGAAYLGWNQKRLSKNQEGMLIGALIALVCLGVFLTFVSVPRAQKTWALWPLALYATIIYPTMFLKHFIQKRKGTLTAA
jgi:peptidoglycan/LPS O-acetylase OafA/YrhL